MWHKHIYIYIHSYAGRRWKKCTHRIALYQNPFDFFIFDCFLFSVLWGFEFDETLQDRHNLGYKSAELSPRCCLSRSLIRVICDLWTKFPIFTNVNISFFFRLFFSFSLSVCQFWHVLISKCRTVSWFWQNQESPNERCGNNDWNFFRKSRANQIEGQVTKKNRCLCEVERSPSIYQTRNVNKQTKNIIRTTATIVEK